MDNIRIRQNYVDYERVKNAFKLFIQALVWESIDIDEGVGENEVYEDIDKYCNAHGDQMIALANDSISKFIRELKPRFEVRHYEVDGNCIKHEIIRHHIRTGNLELALKKAAEHYRYGKHPHVEIYDNETNKYIVEWDCA
jgi:hypothetical protein